MGRPDQICVVEKAVSLLIEHPVEEFLKRAKLRSAEEILDKTDLIFRYHWATEEARINCHDNTGGINGEVVMEWHYALNWLINIFDESWDNISTNT